MRGAFVSIILIATMMGHCFAYSGEGDEVNNGGGIAEKNILYAYHNLRFFIARCLNSELCKLNAKELAVLNSIHKTLPQEYKTEHQIEFVSGRENPGFFKIDGGLKIAKTGDKVGDKIYINSDLLIRRNGEGVETPVDIPEAVILLVHEFGHHHDKKMGSVEAQNRNHLFLDTIGIKVAMVMRNSIQTYPLYPHTNQISLVVINKFVQGRYPAMLLYANDDVVDISKEFIEAIYCYDNSRGSDFNEDHSWDYLHKTDDEYPNDNLPYYAILHNVYWDDVEKIQEKKIKLVLEGRLALQCKSDNNQFNIYRGHKRIRMKLRMNADKFRNLSTWKILPKTVKVKQTMAPLWEWFDLPFI